MDYLGFHTYLKENGKVERVLRRDSVQRVKRKLKKFQENYKEGEISMEEIARNLFSRLGHAGHGDTWKLRNAILSKYFYSNRGHVAMRVNIFKGKHVLFLVLSALFLVICQFQVGRADAGISLDGIAGQRVLFGSISGDYTMSYLDDKGDRQDQPYIYSGPILWRAVSTDIISEDSEVGTVTLLSEYLLGGSVQYDTDESRGGPQSAQFNGSIVQKWLNETKSLGFLEYFDAQERAAIPELMIPESEKRVNNQLDTKFEAGKSQVFILNQGGQEVETELDDFNRSFAVKVINEQHRICYDLYLQGPNTYWTRSCGEDPASAARVDAGGGLFASGNVVEIDSIGVRPALKINLQSVIFKSSFEGPNLKSLLGFDPQDAVAVVAAAAAEGDPPLISKAYMLYCATVDVPVASVDLSVSGNELTISFDQPAAHAYTDTASADALAAKFTVSNDTTPITVTSAAVTDGKLVLTLSETFTYGADTSDVTVAYKGLDDANDTDGIGFPATRTAMKSLGGDPTPTGGSSSNCSSGVGAAFFALAGLSLVGKKKR